MARPTFAQEQYAQSLVERLREEHAFGAESLATNVYQCQDIGEMSRLIDKMKRLLRQIKEADEQAGLSDANVQ